MRFIKLMYLSDRKAMELYGFPISGDHYFSMNKGPVLSQTEPPRESWRLNFLRKR